MLSFFVSSLHIIRGYISYLYERSKVVANLLLKSFHFFPFDVISSLSSYFHSDPHFLFCILGKPGWLPDFTMRKFLMIYSRNLTFRTKKGKVHIRIRKCFHFCKVIRVALFQKILFKIVILHNIKRHFPKNSKNYEFSRKLPISRLLILTV